jgi:hypothetical protein
MFSPPPHTGRPQIIGGGNDAAVFKLIFDGKPYAAKYSKTGTHNPLLLRFFREMAGADLGKEMKTYLAWVSPRFRLHKDNMEFVCYPVS